MEERKIHFIIDDNEAKQIEQKFRKMLSNVYNMNVLAQVFLDKIETEIIIGLAESYLTRKQNGEYREGMREGYKTAKQDMAKKISNLKLKI